MLRVTGMALMAETTSGENAESANGRPESSSRPLISIIVPVFNEEDNVDRTYAELKRVTGELMDYQFEFLFTDNHSTDTTFKKLSSIAALDPAVRVARFARNFGFQQSVLTGYRLARGAAAIQIDADLQDPPSMFAAFLQKWSEGFDVVVGVRRSRKRACSCGAAGGHITDSCVGLAGLISFRMVAIFG